MKKVTLTFLVLSFLPGIALADTVKTTTVTQYGPAPIESLVMERGGFLGFMDRVTTTITRTETKNARSETEYLADRPNPGTKIVSTEVKEEIRFK